MIKHKVIYNSRPHKLVAEANELGKDGWEAVSITYNNHDHSYMILMKKK